MDNSLINTMIAERVMGYSIARHWCYEDYYSGIWHSIDLPDELLINTPRESRHKIKECIYIDDTWMPIPDYAGDTVSALHIIKRMRDLGYRSRYQESPLDLDTYEWIFVDSQREWTCAFRANTIPLAICGAALGMINYDNG